MRLIGTVLSCACLLWSAAPTPCHADPTALSLGQRGQQLRATIDAAYKELRVSKTLKNTVHDGNDVTGSVLGYIPLGMPMSDAEAVLQAAGCRIGSRQDGRRVASAHMRDRFFDLKHALSVELTPRSLGDSSVVGAVKATIYLEYVSGANAR